VRVRSHLTSADDIGVIRTCESFPDRTEKVISPMTPDISVTMILYTHTFLVISTGSIYAAVLSVDHVRISRESRSS
jgi:hypothetical protein